MTIPDSICIMPFVSLGTKPDGIARLCCMAPSLEVKKDGNLVNLDGTELEQIWNGETYQSVRSKMINGERLPECAACWKEEAAGKKSKRLKENTKFAHHFDRISNCKNGKINDLPVHLDLRLGNTCNLRCQTCNPLFSSAFAADFRHHENDWKEDQLFNSQYAESLHRSYNASNWTSDPIFWEEIEKLAESAEEIYLSGGEPTLVPKLSDFLEKCVERKHINSRIRLNSNMTYLPDRMLSALSHFRRVDWGASVDAVGLRNNWLRNPSKFEVVEQNIKKIINLGSPFRIEINCTVSLFNVFVLPELYDWAHKLGIDLVIDVLHSPEFMQLENVPEKVKELAKVRLENLIQSRRLKKHERHGIEYVLNRLNRPGNPESWKHVIRYAHMTDKWRHESFADACPELAEFII